MSIRYTRSSRETPYHLEHHNTWNTPQPAKFFKNGHQDLERGPTLCYCSLRSTLLNKFFDSIIPSMITHKSKMAARGPQNGRRGLERGPTLCYCSLRLTLLNMFFDLIILGRSCQLLQNKYFNFSPPSIRILYKRYFVCIFNQLCYFRIHYLSFIICFLLSQPDLHYRLI